MEKNKILVGDNIETLKTLPDNSIDCCITSPPYYGLRDYGTGKWVGGDPNCPHKRMSKYSEHTSTGHAQEELRGNVGDAIYKTVCPLCGAVREDKQVGLEESPEEYIDRLVNIFREVKRVLKDDGTLWLNIGDSYAGGQGRWGGTDNLSDIQNGNKGSLTEINVSRKWEHDIIKPKDLIGIPWKLAEALKRPYYTGSIKNESDRVWLAATIDSEGCICGTVHDRKDGCGVRKSLFINITNTNMDMLNNAKRIYPNSSIGQHTNVVEHISHFGNRDVYRWSVIGGVESKLNFICEIYPYLIVKKKQALVAYNFLILQRNAKKDGHSDRKEDANRTREKLIQMLGALNSGEDIDVSDLKEPPSMYEQGWYLRSDICWQKPNPMPESVRDRCTKSHEYIFMLSKSPNYYFDYEAIQEPCNIQNPSNHIKFGGEKYPDNVENRIYSGNEYKPRTKNCQYDGQKPNSMHVNRENGGKDKQYLVRNKRDVWTINPSTFKGAHFATFPEELVANCLLAGCPKDGIVLDPFFGSGTVGVVAKKHHRNYIGCELNEEYVKMAEKRLKSTRKALF